MSDEKDITTRAGGAPVEAVVRLLRRMYLFTRIVWREWDPRIPEQSFMVDVNTAWDVAKIVH